MIFSDSQIHELTDIVMLNHIVFLAQNIGIEILSESDLQLLSLYGIDVKKIEENNLFDAFNFGLLSSSLDQEQVEDLDYNKFKKFIQSEKYLPLTDQEKNVFKQVQRQAYKDIKGLGNRISSDLSQVFIEVDKNKRNQYEQTIQNEAEKAVLNRETVKDLVSSLGHKTGDWNRDFGRIADFLMHSSFDEGRAISIGKRYGADAIVYKSVYEGACDHCKRLYLSQQDNIQSEPIHFKLSDLVANGTNIGRKAKEWLAVLGSTHPWCRCLIHRFIPGYKWNESTRLYDIPIGFERKVQRKSKIKVKIGDENWKEI